MKEEFERRHSSDYDDFAYSSAEEIDELLPKATAFIAAIGDIDILPLPEKNLSFVQRI